MVYLTVWKVSQKAGSRRLWCLRRRRQGV
jgi:hypothetical protein